MQLQWVVLCVVCACVEKDEHEDVVDVFVCVIKCVYACVHF
jgi:hypothetical protein